MEIKFEFDFRVAYADTDRLGVVYYGNYFTLFERGRTELMRHLGLRYRELEEKSKLFLPVSETACQYLSPAHYDDLIRVVTRIKEVAGAHVDFDYEIFNAETQEKLATGYSRHPVVNEKWKPTRLPRDIREKLIQSFS